MSRNQVFFAGCLSFLGGVFLQNIFFSIFIGGYFCFLLCLVVWNSTLYCDKKSIFTYVFPVFFFFGSLLSYTYIQQIFKNYTILTPLFLESSYTGSLQVVDIYKQHEHDTDYLMKLQQLGEKDFSQDTILGIIRIPTNISFTAGDIVEAQLKLYPLGIQDSSFIHYFLSQRIYFRAYPYEFERINSQSQNPKYYRQIRQSIIDKIDTLFPDKQAKLLSGILIGARESLSQELRDNFNNSGLTHIIAVSGYNITILIIFIAYVLILFPRYIQVGALCILIVFFVQLVGPSMPVLRAAIMGIIGFIVVSLGRKGDTLSILLASLAIIILFSPYSLNYDISLHLSFFAVLGIILFFERLKKLLFFVSESFFIRDTLAMTFAAMILNIPIIIGNFEQISVVSPLTNLLVVWNIPFIMLFGSMSIVLSYFFELGSFIFGYIAFLFLSFDISVVTFFGSQSWSVIHVSFGSGKYYLIGAYYVFMLFVYLYLR